MGNQKVGGFFNNAFYTENTFYEKDSVDILPSDLDELLDYLSDEDNYIDESFGFTVPDLTKKNIKNGIDENYYDFMKDDFSYFQDIAEILKNDSDNLIKRKYRIASRLLQQQYFSSFQERMKEFITSVISKHSKETKCTSEVSLKLCKLLHYMYSNCDIGIKP